MGLDMLGGTNAGKVNLAAGHHMAHTWFELRTLLVDSTHILERFIYSNLWTPLEGDVENQPERPIEF